MFGGRGDARRRGEFSEEGEVFGTGEGFRRTGSFFSKKGSIFVGRGISEGGEVRTRAVPPIPLGNLVEIPSKAECLPENFVADATKRMLHTQRRRM